MAERAAQAAQQVYFREFREQCHRDVNGMLADLARWESADATILHMTMDEQATYADYVTRKMCSEQPADVVAATARQLLQPHPVGLKLNSCHIGNMALLNKSVCALEGYEQLKEQLLQKYHCVIAEQMELAEKKF